MKKPTRRQFMAASATAATLTTVAAQAEPESPAESEDTPTPYRGHWREFRSVAIDEGGTYYQGFGMTLDKAIRREVEIYERSRDHEVGRGIDTPGGFAAEFPDVTMWEGFRIVAMLRPQPDGSMKVVRL